MLWWIDYKKGHFISSLHWSFSSHFCLFGVEYVSTIAKIFIRTQQELTKFLLDFKEVFQKGSCVQINILDFGSGYAEPLKQGKLFIKGRRE